MCEIDHYLTPTGTDLYQVWLNDLKDRSGRARITVRVNRLAAGAFGNCKPVDSGVWELRIDTGPGYSDSYEYTQTR